MKRGFDVLASAIGLILLSPVLLVIALAIKLTSPGPVLYFGKRVGRGGRLFRIAKFRTMIVAADRGSSDITVMHDARVTPLGRVLRRTKLDELPQLFNVLRGDMSLVGPRPESPQWVALYSDEQRRVLDVRPGISDPVQIMFRHEEDYLTTDRHYFALMQIKVAKQLEYIEQRSFWGDLRVLLDTFGAIVRRQPCPEALRVYQVIGEKPKEIPPPVVAQELAVNAN